MRRHTTRISKIGLIILALGCSVSLLSCNSEEKKIKSVDPVNWQKREVANMPNDSMLTGTTYLSVYSQIYSQTEHITHDLTVTISMRNTSLSDTLYLSRTEYYDTHGNAIRTYFNNMIYVEPMETVEIVIAERDQDGGTGGNFLFDWSINPESSEPLFEAVMISTSGQQGLSFSTQGRRLK